MIKTDNIYTYMYIWLSLYIIERHPESTIYIRVALMHTSANDAIQQLTTQIHYYRIALREPLKGNEEDDLVGDEGWNIKREC